MCTAHTHTHLTRFSSILCVYCTHTNLNTFQFHPLKLPCRHARKTSAGGAEGGPRTVYCAVRAGQELASVSTFRCIHYRLGQHHLDTPNPVPASESVHTSRDRLARSLLSCNKKGCRGCLYTQTFPVQCVCVSVCVHTDGMNIKCEPR